MTTHTGSLPFTLSVSSGGYSLTDTASAPAPAPPPSAPAALTPTARVIDSHFGCYKGWGFWAGHDVGGLVPYTLSAAATKGALGFSLTGAAPAGAQLLVLLGTDDEYYTVPSLSMTGSFCDTCDPLPCDVAAGQNAWNFWDNNAHPNSKGYAAIADYALRQDFAVWRKAWGGPPEVLAPATITANLANSVQNAGSASSGNGWSVIPGGAGGGARWSFVLPSIGDYRATFECARSAPGPDLDLTILSNGAVVKTYAIKTVSPARHEVDFTASGPCEIRLPGACYPSSMTILREDEAGLGSLNQGRHLVIGDSWVADPAGPAARLAARLPLATFVTSGVGGNMATDVLARIDAVLAAGAPFDYVWILVGTNDICQGVQPAAFTANLFTLFNKVQVHGAVPITFTPFAGSTDYPARIDLARTYMAQVPYWA